MSNKLIIKNTLTRFRTSYGFESDEVFDDIAAMLLSAAESEYLKVFWENIAAEQASRILENFYLNVLKRLLKYQHSFTLSAEKFKTSLAINNAIQVEIEHAKRCKMLLEHFANYDEYKVEPLKPSSLIHSVFDTVVSAANESITTAREGLEVSATNGNLRNLSPPADAPNNDIQADGMHIASIVMSGVNFLLVPLSYIYYAAKGDPVPFNAKNNVKWAISGVTLALGLISLLVPPAGIGIMFTMAAVGLITSIAGFSMQLYERFQTKSKLLNTKNNIRENRLLINENRAEAAIIKEDIVSNGMTDERQTKLNTLYEEFAAQQVELKSQKVIEHKLTAKVQQTYSSL